MPLFSESSYRICACYIKLNICLYHQSYVTKKNTHSQSAKQRSQLDAVHQVQNKVVSGLVLSHPPS